MFNKKISGGLAIAAFLGWSMSAGAVVIDDFSVDQNSQPLIDTTDDGSSVSSTTAIGGGVDRFVEIEKTGPALPDTGPATGTIKDCTDDPLIPGLPPAGTRCLSYSSDTGVIGRMTARWDFGTALDMTTGGDDTLALGINFADFGSLLTITVTSGASTSTLTPPATPGGIAGFPGQEVEYLYSSFSNPALFSSVDSLELAFTYPVASTDMEIRLLETRDNVPPPSVPVPGTVLLMGLALVGMRRFVRKS